MSKLSLTCSLLLLQSALMVPTATAKWFMNQDLFTVAHQKLLEGKTNESFGSMVQAWQQSPSAEQQNNLNELLQLAITEDCGHSLDRTALPSWLTSVVIQREMVQNQNQILPRLAINGTAERRITEIKFIHWPDQVILSATPKLNNGGYFSLETRRLEKASSEGLYQLVINGDGDVSFKTWVLLTRPQSKQRIGWIDSRSWRIERNGLPDRACPSPVLSMNVYDLEDTSWTPLWTENVDGKLPTTLPKLDLPDGRYWLSVGVIESRWQGEIGILDIQSITRPVDHSGL
ncbi:DUF2861 family protein [Photobacterium aphoticum]|uniref:DUF2861 domain-containing protein n=2 Tax=Photobacterium aphoticum TaxID=754436 RepID=A0A090QJ09_9GAMM|nr:DUF2861 family protein [Photobacterium aphoticum]GAL02911.1 hypothetical protein JCM19237_5804 [Photobacterium aphoticum]GHA34112.1 hypothetical protein GCM10007086_04300 [Photobacterium aphoticum]